jgi:hypothetical protein
MRPVTVNKASLMERLIANRDAHAGIYEKAMAVYESKVREWFETNLALVKEGKWVDVRRSCPYPVPEEHTEDYQRAIDMLTWDLSDTYELSEGDFDQYVNDNWGWARSFTANSAAYLVTEGGT